MAASLNNPAEHALQLKDIHLPDSPGFWPLAPGWWILLLVLLVLIVWLTLMLIRKTKQRKHQKSIFNQYMILEKELLDKPNNESIATINTFLRQLAVNKYPRSDIASLTGMQWLEFLDKTGKTKDFSKGVGHILVDAPYQITIQQNFNVSKFTLIIRNWIKTISKKTGENRRGGSE